jgi:hypothetical protein
MEQVGYGELSLTTTGFDYPMLAGNLASILISTIVTVIVSLVKPDDKPYDWEGTRSLLMVEEEFTGASVNCFGAVCEHIKCSNANTCAHTRNLSADPPGSQHLSYISYVESEPNDWSCRLTSGSNSQACICRRVYGPSLSQSTWRLVMSFDLRRPTAKHVHVTEYTVLFSQRHVDTRA